MFTGIINHIGKVNSIKNVNDEKEISIISKLDIRKLEIGQSIACNGICLTIIKILEYNDGSEVFFFLSKETINKTNVNFWKKESKINLELAMRSNSLFDGHMVTGHIDSVATVTKVTKSSNSHIVNIMVDDTSLEYLVSKGSVTLNGVSLTVNKVNNSGLTVNIIPHTWNNTNFNVIQKGDKLNFEADIIAKYVKKYTK